jgi:heme/copper-type cytochrome/quinol oxidase subunit 1
MWLSVLLTDIFLYFKNLKIEYFDMFKSLLMNIIIIRKFISKKILYTINHKKLGLLYFYYALITAIMGSYLATCIRLEMAYPGSPFFNGDSLKYLQVITAHALIMIFFVVVPIFFGGFANYFLPYHVGSKDVAYPRLNNMGF